VDKGTPGHTHATFSVAVLSFAILIVFVLMMAVSGLLGTVIGPMFGRVIWVPLVGPVPSEGLGFVLGFVLGLVVGFLAATLSCGALFALIAIVNNTRRTKELLSSRLH